MKKIITAFLIACLCAVMVLPVLAADDDYDWNIVNGKEGLYVTYKADGTWDTNLTEGWDDEIGDMQPGDMIVINVSMNNEYKGDAYWYMENKVLKSLEDLSENSRTSGGGYTYILTYTNPAGVDDDLFNSGIVGGEGSAGDRQGLNEATNGLEDYFYLDTLKEGDKAQVTLKVGLDGESQGNDYQDTIAQLQLRFGVEQPNAPTVPSKPTGTPATGDTNNLILLIVLFGASGIIVLAIAIILLARFRRQRKAGE